MAAFPSGEQISAAKEGFDESEVVEEESLSFSDKLVNLIAVDETKAPKPLSSAQIVAVSFVGVFILLAGVLVYKLVF